MTTSVTTSLRRLIAGVLAGLGLGMASLLAAAQEPPQNFALHDAPKLLPEIRFQDGEGKTLGLADFRGRVILLNIWATWCGPCRREMPTLDRLQAKLGGPDFEVVALSIDRAGLDVVTKFYVEVGVEHLAMYIDSTGRATREFGVVGLPTTLLIDREGREIGRLVGPAEWDTPDMVAFIRARLAGETGWLGPERSSRASSAAPAEAALPPGPSQGGNARPRLDLPATGSPTFYARAMGRAS